MISHEIEAICAEILAHSAAPERPAPITRTLLHRRDPDQRMWRFYRMWIDTDLFERVVVLREWGRIGASGKVRVDVHDTPAEAAAWLARLERAKRRRGYIGTAD